MSKRFSEVFGFDPDVQADAPGRVNLLGEHTDYNDGFVLPTVIPQKTTVQLAASQDDSDHLYAARFDEYVEHAPDAEIPAGFARYVLGCVEVLREQGHVIGPIALHVDSDVPIGAGLSSSAALEVAVLRALRAWKALPLDDVELALLAQQAEIRFAEVRCGIMDQMACSLAAPQQMLFLDTRSLHRALLPFPPDTDYVVIDSGVSRALAGSAYNQRRSECEQAARQLGVRALRDVERLDAVMRLPDPLARRARHVVTENARVQEAATGVSAARFGELMNASHASLRDDFEVSVDALDRLVDLLRNHGDVYGARLTGAGFGGACVALVAAGAQARVGGDVVRAYGRAGRVLV